jgi:bifunctional non-homologous end joining protein LigD
MKPDWLDDLDEDVREQVARGEMPDGADLMKATLTHEPFSDPDWLFERKLDGERVLAIKEDDSVRLLTRNDKNAGNSYPELVDALGRQPTGKFAIDGEVVAFKGSVTSFARLQQRFQLKDPEKARNTGIAVYFYCFDILNLDGYATTKIPLRQRKQLLRGTLEFDDPLRFLPHRNADGEQLLREACEKGWEGLIAKDASATYHHSRSRKWLKFKCTRQQEMVIAGFTDPKGSRAGFGALLLGYYEDGQLRYAGKVGTGFNDRLLKDLRERMDTMTRDDSPFDDQVAESGAHFIEPELVGEIGFTEWTREGRLRHPRFLGLRRDKKPRDVVREDAR